MSIPHRFLIPLSLCLACPKAPSDSEPASNGPSDEHATPAIEHVGAEEDNSETKNVTDSQTDTSETDIAAILQPETHHLDRAMRQDWPPQEWTHARAYAYNFVPFGPGQQLRVWDEGGWSTNLETQVELTEAQANAALELTHRTLGGVNASKCAFPRHAVVFFDESDQPIASVNVCFECTDIMLWPSYNPDPREAMNKYRELSTTVLDNGEEIDQPLVFTVHNEVMGKWERLFRVMALPDYPTAEPAP